MKDVKEEVRQMIKDGGLYINELDSPGPITIIFTKVLSDYWTKNSKDGEFELVPREKDNYIQKYAIEMGTWRGKSLEDFKRDFIVEVAKETPISIVKLYTAVYTGSEYIIRFGHLNNYFGEQVEMSLEDMEKAISTPDIRYELRQDLKAYYDFYVSKNKSSN